MKLALPLQPPADFKDGLYTSPRKEVVYTKSFRYPPCKISLRFFSIPSDMPTIYNWAWKETTAVDLIAASYQYAHESDFARSYMAVMNNVQPLCEVDICHASQDELCDQFPTLNGDYILRLLAPQKERSRLLLSCVLQTCLEYFFRFREVERILMEPDVENIPYNDLLVKSGFHFQQIIYQQYKTSNLYYYTRPLSKTGI